MGICLYCHKEIETPIDTYYCSIECSQKHDIEEEYETIETDEIRCPHCDYVYNDELISEYEADEDEYECPSCGNKFILTANTHTVFTANLTREDIDRIYNERNDRPCNYGLEVKIKKNSLGLLN